MGKRKWLYVLIWLSPIVLIATMGALSNYGRDRMNYFKTDSVSGALSAADMIDTWQNENDQTTSDSAINTQNVISLPANGVRKITIANDGSGVLSIAIDQTIAAATTAKKLFKLHALETHTLPVIAAAYLYYSADITSNSWRYWAGR